MTTNASAALGCSLAGLETLAIKRQEIAFDVGFNSLECSDRIKIGLSNVARSSAFNRSASQAASVVPATIGGLSDTPVAPSITHAQAFVAPMASSLTNASGDAFEMRSIILNRLSLPISKIPLRPLPR